VRRATLLVNSTGAKFSSKLSVDVAIKKEKDKKDKDKKDKKGRKKEKKKDK